MQKRWFLSQTFRDAEGCIWPCAGDYGARWRMPRFPEDEDNGWALVEVYVNPAQVEAAKTEPLVVVCPDKNDPRPVPQAVIDCYANWGATAGMNMLALLYTLSDKEPLYTMEW